MACTVVPVIMAGGSGTRLWPLSRALYPKQFQSLISEKTMFQETVLRLEGLDVALPIIICNEEHRFIVAEQLRSIDKLGLIILEPEGRNTAPAVGLAAGLVSETCDGDTLLLVLAADHRIGDERAFVKAVQRAIPLAQAGALVTFGVIPSSPHTGYGYIKRGLAVNEDDLAYKVDAFVEKPDAQTAASYLEAGGYYWNSGMFLFQANTYLEELEKYKPDIAFSCRKALLKRQSDLDFIRIDRDAFLSCPSDSIDYAVMEKTEQAVVVPLDAGWSDIGAWSTLWDVQEKDDVGNVLRGDVIAHDSHNSLIYGEHRLITSLGIDDMVIVDTKDALLVAHKDRVQDIKGIVEQLQVQGRSESQLHREVYRPWGQYDCLDMGAKYQAKRITVKPGAKLSSQMHRHRAEHWIVVSGTACVTCRGESFFLAENESTYIGIGEVHSLENPGKIDLEIIEVQSGSYLGEDDIVRFEDVYGREE